MREAYTALVDHILEGEAAQWERYGDAFAAIGLRRDVGAGDDARFPHPKRDLPTRLIHQHITRANLLLRPDGRVMFVDLDDTRLGDPADDAYSFMKAVARLAPGKRQFLRRYEEGRRRADPRMAG